MATDEKCSAEFQGCQGNAPVAFLCPREQHRLWLCRSCFNVWRGEVRANPEMEHRCPNCKDLGRGNAVPLVRPATTPAPLAGVVAEVVRSAAWLENIPADQVTRILSRLAATAPWLADVRAPVNVP